MVFVFKCFLSKLDTERPRLFSNTLHGSVQCYAWQEVPLWLLAGAMMPNGCGHPRLTSTEHLRFVTLCGYETPHPTMPSAPSYMVQVTPKPSLLASYPQQDNPGVRAEQLVCRIEAKKDIFIDVSAAPTLLVRMAEETPE